MLFKPKKENPRLEKQLSKRTPHERAKRVEQNRRARKKKRDLKAYNEAVRKSLGIKKPPVYNPMLQIGTIRHAPNIPTPLPGESIQTAIVRESLKDLNYTVNPAILTFTKPRSKYTTSKLAVLKNLSRKERKNFLTT
jgi:hypothetical protein